MRTLGAFSLCLAMACSGPPPRCDAQTCDGCCTEHGICEPGFAQEHCGIRGVSCSSCPTERSCIAGICVKFEPVGGGSGSTGGGGGGGSAAGGGAALGGGAGGAGFRHIDSGYPAPHPDLLQEVSLGGPVLSSPRFMSVSFANDDPTFVTRLDDFIATVGTTDYWTQTTAEYGVGAATASAPVHVNETAAGTITDDEIRAWLQTNLSGAAPPLGAPDPSTVYVLWYPAAATLIASSASCYGFLAYHYAFTYDGGTDGGPLLAYAVIPRCTGVLSDAGELDIATSSAAHELIEAATDPSPFAPGWRNADEGHVVWNMMLFGEAADLCEADSDSFYVPAGYPYMVQRSWSNAAAAQGFGCVPVATPYFNVMPLFTDSVGYAWDLRAGATEGIDIAIGQTKTLEVLIYTSAPTGPVRVAAVSYPDPSTLAFGFPKSDGVNGDVLQVAVTHRSNDPYYGGAPFMLTATLGNRVHYYFGFVGD